MRKAACSLVVAGTVLALGAPAFAQMKMSSPTAAPAGGDSDLRPTDIGGAEMARILSEGAFVAGIGGPNGRHGLGNNMELTWSSGLLAFSTAPTFGIAPRAGVKYLIQNGPAMSIAGYGYLSPKINNLRTFDAAFGGGVPISMWKLGPGDLHIVPAYDIGNVVAPPAVDFGLGAISVSLVYEMPLTPKWSVVFSDRLGGNVATVGAAANTLGVGGRINYSKNVTLDVGSVMLTGTTLGVTLVTAAWSWGGKMSEVVKGIGL